jgi:hypothetical protein
MHQVPRSEVSSCSIVKRGDKGAALIVSRVMLSRVVAASLILIVSCSAKGQQQAATASVIGVQEFPVVFQQSVTAGRTPVGTKIQAKLTMATLLNGTVVPQNAEFSGQVVVSQARTESQPSRLSVRLDSLRWKDGSASVKAYVTNWFYPSIAESGQTSQSGPWQGPTSPVPVPSYSPSAPDDPNSTTSQHREKMKDVDSERSSDGTVMLVSKQHNLKLDHSTVYVLTPGDLVPATK